VVTFVGSKVVYWSANSLGRTNGASIDYVAYGVITSVGGPNSHLANTNPYRYASGYLDTATGLYQYGQRYYQPTLGRWTQQDTLNMIGDPANGNRYTYTGDDPINNIDPSGQGFCFLGHSPDGSCRGSDYFKPYPADPVGCGFAFATTTIAIVGFAASIPLDVVTGGLALPLSYLAGAGAFIGIVSIPFVRRT